MAKQWCETDLFFKETGKKNVFKGQVDWQLIYTNAFSYPANFLKLSVQCKFSPCSWENLKHPVYCLWTSLRFWCASYVVGIWLVRACSWWSVRERDRAVLREQEASSLQQVLQCMSRLRVSWNDSVVSWSLSEFRSVQWQQRVDTKWPPAKSPCSVCLCPDVPTDRWRTWEAQDLQCAAAMFVYYL